MTKDVISVPVRNIKSGRIFQIPERLVKDSVYMSHHGLSLETKVTKQYEQEQDSGFMELPEEVRTDMGMASAPKRGRKNQNI